MAKALIFLADGFEEVEAITPIDYLRRAGIEVTTVAVGTLSTTVTGGHGIPVIADTHMNDLDIENLSFDALVLPGGIPGADNLAADEKLISLIRTADSDGAFVAAICAAPAVVLGTAGADILGSRAFTCFPGFEERTESPGHEPSRVVVQGTLITAVGAGAAAEFAEHIVEHLLSPSDAATLNSRTLQPRTFTPVKAGG